MTNRVAAAQGGNCPHTYTLCAQPPYTQRYHAHNGKMKCRAALRPMREPTSNHVYYCHYNSFHSLYASDRRGWGGGRRQEECTRKHLHVEREHEGADPQVPLRLPLFQ